MSRQSPVRESIKELQKFNLQENQKAVLLVDGLEIFCSPDSIDCQYIEAEFDDSVISVTVGDAELHSGNKIHKIDTLVIPLSQISAVGILSSAENEA